MRIDAHQHFWHYNPVRDAWITDEMDVIRRDFLPDDLLPHLKKNAIDGSVAIQADQSEEETRFLIALAREADFIKGVVGWIDLKAETLKERLEHVASIKQVKGFRHIVQAEPDGFLSDPSFVAGVKMLGPFNYSYDLLIYPHQLIEAVSFVREIPETRIILDHLAKPAIKTGGLKEWGVNIRRLAAYENVACKISGMVTEADWQGWTEEDFYPYLDILLETFGTKRLLYGSDWPVCLVAASYDQQLSIVESYLSQLSERERNDMMGENAVRIYQL